MATVIDDVYSALHALGGQATVREIAGRIVGGEPEKPDMSRVQKVVGRLARQRRIEAAGLKRDEQGRVATSWRVVE